MVHSTVIATPPATTRLSVTGINYFTPSEFVARMEDLLELYQLPYDPRFPVVGMDEMPKQLIAETRIPLPVCEGHPVLYDYEYERKGVCLDFGHFKY